MNKKSLFHALAFVFCLVFVFDAQGQQKDDELRVVLIRHGEKPEKGNELSCQGVNRSKALPAVLNAKIGLPGIVYVPSSGQSGTAKHSRMYQTITPFTEKYRLSLNSSYKVDDISGVSKNILKQHGTVLVVWEHNGLEDIAEKLGVKEKMRWKDNDFDSIWIITFSKKGKARLAVDQEGLHPSTRCL